MGTDKAKLLLDGKAMGERVGSVLAATCSSVTVLGREPLGPYNFMKDRDDFQGPLAAISRYVPKADFVMIASCDVPWIEPALVETLQRELGDSQAAIPELDGRLQPLCALYRSSALQMLAEIHKSGERRIMRWTASLRCVIVSEEQFPIVRCCRNVNSTDDLA